MNAKKMTISLTLLAVAALTLYACRSSEPTIDPEAQKTGFAQTANSEATQTIEAQPTPTQTLEPSPTHTSTPELTATSVITPTQAMTLTATLGGGQDAATWLSNVPSDNTKFIPGEEFTVTWTLENSGSSTWTMNYYIEFASGEQMGAVEKVFLPYPVPPNTNVQISVDFVAPETEGSKRSNWRLVNSNDFAFYEFYVIIDVDEAGGETLTPEPTAEP
ncbi:MAG: NBR1-Ig-like domain-containing protein [Anaerolineales bacterium]